MRQLRHLALFVSVLLRLLRRDPLVVAIASHPRTSFQPFNEGNVEACTLFSTLAPVKEIAYQRRHTPSYSWISSDIRQLTS